MKTRDYSRKERGASDPVSIVLTILIGGALYYLGSWVIDYMRTEKDHRRAEMFDKSDEPTIDEMGYSTH